MKAGVIRKLAREYSFEKLEEAADKLAEELDPGIEIGGDDDGERLTNCMVAARVRERIDAGEDEKEAFKAVMAQVRETLRNE